MPWNVRLSSSTAAAFRSSSPIRCLITALLWKEVAPVVTFLCDHRTVMENLPIWAWTTLWSKSIHLSHWVGDSQGKIVIHSLCDWPWELLATKWFCHFWIVLMAGWSECGERKQGSRTDASEATAIYLKYLYTCSFAGYKLTAVIFFAARKLIERNGSRFNKTTWLVLNGVVRTGTKKTESETILPSSTSNA